MIVYAQTLRLVPALILDVHQARGLRYVGWDWEYIRHQQDSHIRLAALTRLAALPSKHYLMRST